MEKGVVNTGVKNRVDQAEYVEIDDAYELMGTGFKEANEEPGAQVADKKYINMKSKTKSISMYEWVKAFSADQIPSEKVIKDFVEIGQMQKVGADAERNHVTVHLDEPVAEKNNTFRARHVRVAVEISSYPDNDGEMGVEGNMHAVSDMKEGTFDTTTKTFTPAGGAVVGE